MVYFIDYRAFSEAHVDSMPLHIDHCCAGLSEDFNGGDGKGEKNRSTKQSKRLDCRDCVDDWVLGERAAIYAFG